MIKKTLFALSLVMGMTLFIYFTEKPKEKTLTSLTPEKEYPVSLTIQEWIVVTSHPDDVAKNIREKTIQKVGSQLQSQLKVEDSLFKQKALQDSLDKIKSKKNLYEGIKNGSS